VSTSANTDVPALYAEVKGYLDETDVAIDGERLYSNYERVTGILIRLQEIRNDLAYEEIIGMSSPDRKKFRTMILDPVIERFEKVAVYESRKISARAIEANLER